MVIMELVTAFVCNKKNVFPSTAGQLSDSNMTVLGQVHSLWLSGATFNENTE